MNRYHSLGLMTGTSMDGIDAAIVVTDGVDVFEKVEFQSFAYPKFFHYALKATEYVVQQANGDLSALQDSFGQQIEKVLQQSKHESSIVEQLCECFEIKSIDNLKVDDISLRSTTYHIELMQRLNHPVDVIGYHGQTVFHQPAMGLSIQMGNPEFLAKQSGCQVVANFREADLTAGGQGAPIAPIYHLALAQKLGLDSMMVINCGGITNVSVIHDSDPNELLAYDAGPGNVMLDRYLRQHTNLLMDVDGQLGQQGRVQAEIISQLEVANASYYRKLPPKSLDSYDFALPQGLDKYSVPDVCASLAYFSAKQLVDSLQLLDNSIPKVCLLTGGGWSNPNILSAFQDMMASQFPMVSVELASKRGLACQAIEAELMAYAAVRRLHDLPLTYPGTTGVAHPQLGGTIFG